ncbi:hypothetical protein DHEL01_v210747 [Diaporthe helianthi]|uniref:Cytochrome P450 n=1 Tax=Diaporthe helianthi TaxID=158607 RepID=A0A2P5HKS8_DIAHE|nr:hypothetical protein DHEL01_v210747 [Diaporthe helianthi]
MARAGQATLGMSQAGAEILQKDITSDSNSVAGLVPILARTMAPGPALSSMVSQAIKVMSKSIENLTGEKGTCSTINFYEWTRHEMLMATTDAVFGPENPYHDPAVESAWRTFESAYLTISLSPFKTLTARKAFRAREFLASTFVSYLEKGGPKSASEFVRTAHTHNVSHGFSIDDLARFEVGHTHAITGSTGPTTWWLLWHLYSDMAVLRDVREELEQLAESSPSTPKQKTLNLAQLYTRAPILHSTLKEVLRLRTMATAVRLYLDDQLLQDKYLLKKGAGHFLCPGRHFSMSEILAFSAIMVLRFDLKPTAGEWVEPTSDNTPMVSSLHIPDEDIEVEVRERHNRIAIQ